MHVLLPLLWKISYIFVLCYLFPSFSDHLSLSFFPFLQVQENVFVEFNHQELLDFYNKVCFENVNVCAHMYCMCPLW